MQAAFLGTDCSSRLFGAYVMSKIDIFIVILLTRMLSLQLLSTFKHTMSSQNFRMLLLFFFFFLR